jgi:hypothetical protein
MNVFQSSFEHRLREWRDLRTKTSTLSILDKCILIDDWWQQAPLIKQHLHPQDQENWISPWDMLSENIYCPLTRAIGICYTLLLCEITDVRLVVATDSTCEEHYLVLVDNAKYVANYWPKTVISNSLSDFTIKQELSIEILKTKIR